MFSKSGIMAEELKQQLGDVLPTAMVALEKSTGKTAKQLFKMMEQGQLGAEYIMPFLDAMADMAKKNGALESALLSTAKAQDKFMTGAEIAGNTIYTSGFAEGLGELFRDMTEQLEKSGSGLEGLGQLFKLFFNAVRGAINIIMPILDSLFFVFGKISEALNYIFGFDMSGKIVAVAVALGTTYKAVKILTGAMSALGIATNIAFAPIWAIIAAVSALVAGYDELFAFFDSDRIGFFENMVFGGNMLGDSKSTYKNSVATSAETMSRKSVVVHNHNYIDGVKKSFDEQMNVHNGQSVVGVR